ncbi:MAG: hypothetical protein HY907_09515 [Deltaproteobacteria bacterium]|nr:hypothetical protein [Deltaproteobacteria bacterium]
MPSTSARDWVTWDDGFLIHPLGLHLDPRRRAPLGFASDGFGDARARRLIATPETVRFLRRWRSAPSFLPSPYGRSFQLGQSELRLVPAGALPGAAQLEIRWRGATLLYARRILPEPEGLGGAAEAPRADVVLLDAPPAPAPQACARRADTVAAIRAWAERVAQRNGIPVLFAEPHAAAPALAARLGGGDLELRLHPTIYDRVRLCAASGADFRRAWQLRGAPHLGQLVLLPWGGRASGRAVERTSPSTGPRAGGREGGDGENGTGEAAARLLAALREGEGGEGAGAELRTAVVHDGAAALPGGFRPDEVFLLAFSAGVSELVAHVQRTGARETLLSPGTPTVVGSVLRELGIAVTSRLGPPDQLVLAGS